MKTYTATIVTTQTQTVTVEVDDNISPEDLGVELCSAASLSGGEIESEAYDIEELI